MTETIQFQTNDPQIVSNIRHFPDNGQTFYRYGHRWQLVSITESDRIWTVTGSRVQPDPFRPPTKSVAGISDSCEVN